MPSMPSIPSTRARLQCSKINQATYHQAINHPPTTTMDAYQCLLCHPAVYVAADLGNMKSHLGAPTKHNMGPYRCQRAGCAQLNNGEYAVNFNKSSC